MADLSKNVEWKVLDLSDWQRGKVNFKQLKADGFKGVILRVNDASIGMTKDNSFEGFYVNAKAAGLYVGVYWFMRGTTRQMYLAEMSHFIKYTQGKQFELPYYIDVEDSAIFARGKEFVTAMCKECCEYLEKAKKFAGIYCSTYYTEQYIDISVQNRFAFWIADWRNQCWYKNQYGMWQKGTIRTKGINNGCSDVDFDICYVNYPKAIEKRGLNGITRVLHYKTKKETPIIEFEGTATANKEYEVFDRKTVNGIPYGRVTEKGWINLNDCEVE